jgi:uncharacterized cupin superfamily protein
MAEPANIGGVRKINVNDIAEETWPSPKGQFVMAGRGVSEALGRKPDSLNLSERHPFDVEIQRIPAGATATTFHSHSAQWEFYYVLSGGGLVRHDDGEEPIVAGDAFLFKPGEAHQVRNTTTDDLMMLVVADNPIGESTHYPDSGKWVVRSPKRHVLRSAPLDYWDGEE